MLVHTVSIMKSTMILNLNPVQSEFQFGVDSHYNMRNLQPGEVLSMASIINRMRGSKSL